MTKVNFIASAKRHFQDAELLEQNHRPAALTILAYRLATSGKNVLLIDLDLESPGLSGLLLPPENLADFGIVDWLIEAGLGQGDEVLAGMISVSSIGTTVFKSLTQNCWVLVYFPRLKLTPVLANFCAKPCSLFEITTS